MSSPKESKMLQHPKSGLFGSPRRLESVHAHHSTAQSADSAMNVVQSHQASWAPYQHAYCLGWFCLIGKWLSPSKPLEWMKGFIFLFTLSFFVSHQKVSSGMTKFQNKEK